MFGIDDPGIYLGYLLTFISLVIGVVYGIMNWNKGKESDMRAIKKDLKWEKKNMKLKDDL